LYIETDENIMDKVAVNIENEKIDVNVEGIVCPNKMNLYLNARDLNKIKVNGSTDIFCDSRYKNTSMNIVINGSSDITFQELVTTDLNIKINGSGDASLAGKSKTSEIKISGSGDINMVNMETDFLNTIINGSGDLQANVNKEINAKISGSGDIFYKGNPKVNSKISGSGDIIKLKKE
jgi:hypothetical protein